MSANQIDDRTVLITLAGEPLDLMTLRDFFDANADGFSESEMYEIRKTLARGGDYEAGGGAAPRFTISLAEIS